MNVCFNLALFLLANSQKGIVHYFKSQFMDRTFKGLYSPNGFDLALLIPYFIVMVILAGYGMHGMRWCTCITATARTGPPSLRQSLRSFRV